MHLVLIGLSHKTAPVEVREKLAFPEDRIDEALLNLTSKPSVDEAVILSTCNRTEIYTLASDPEKASEDIISFFADFHNMPATELNGYLYTKLGLDVAKHAFSVSSSLDSMIIGEGQILGQVKQAYGKSLQRKTTGRVLNRLFKEALTIGKKVRTDTDIGESAVSISYAAVELAKRLFGELNNKTVLLVGAGKMSELTAKHLTSSGIQNVLVTNRTFQRAEEMAQKFDGEALPFDQLTKSLALADIIISSTGATQVVITKEQMADAMRKRKNRPVFLIDIAVPRDIDPEINNLYNAYLYDIDDLQGVVQTNLSERQKEARKAHDMIDDNLQSFNKWTATLEVVPTITALRQKADLIRQKELAKAVSMLGEIDQSQIDTMNAMAQAIINKLLHEPTIKIKECAGEKEGRAYIKSISELFSLKTKEKN